MDRSSCQKFSFSLVLCAAVAAAFAAAPVEAQCDLLKAPIAPAVGAKVTGGGVTLQWDAVAPSYIVHVQSTSLGLQSYPTLVPSVSIPAPPDEEILWYVECSKTKSPEWQFITVGSSCPRDPVSKLVQPAEGSLIAPGSTVRFEWAPVPLADAYNFYIDGKLHEQGISTNSPALDIDLTPYPDGDHVWAVEVLGEYLRCEPVPPAIEGSFAIGKGCIPVTAGPLLADPAEGTKVSEQTKVTFSWKQVPDATSYEVILLQDGTLEKSLGTTSAFSLTSTLPPGEHQWWVTATNSCSTPVRSEETRLIGVAACPTVAPSLVSPANADSVPDGTVSLSWNPVSGASQYEVFLGQKGGALISQGVTGSTSLNVGPLGPGVSWEWYVTASSADCAPLSSTISAFTTVDCPASGPGLVAPAAGAAAPAGDVTFSWNPVSGAIKYELWINGQLSATTPAGTTTATVSLPGSGSFSWYVVAVLSAPCSDVQSTTSSFTTNPEIICPVAPTLMTPVNGADVTVGQIFFEWSPVDGALSYELALDGAVVYSGPATSATVEVKAIGQHSWTVSAIGDKSCQVAVANKFLFTVQEEIVCPLEAPKLIQPTDRSQVSLGEVTFSWSSVSGAVLYELYLDNTLAFEGTATTTTLKISEARSHEWYVVVYGDPSCPGGALKSAPFSFEAKADVICPTAGPKLTAPANFAQLKPGDVVFSWSSVSGAVEYELFLNAKPAYKGGSTSVTLPLDEGVYQWFVVARGELECPEEFQSATYDLTIKQEVTCPETGPQLSTPANEGEVKLGTVNFSWSPVTGALEYELFVNNASVWRGPETSTSFAIKAEGTYEWYVQAIGDPAACPVSQSSKPFFFRATAEVVCPSAGPKLLAPLDGSALAVGSIKFSWEAVSGAVEYELFIDQKSAWLGPETSTTFSINTEGEYVWYVVAHGDRQACPESPKSLPSTFAVKGGTPCEPPVLTAPAAGATVPAGTVTLQWNGVSGAASYNVYVRLDNGAEQLLGNFVGTAAKLEVKGGSVVSWRVTALIEGCNEPSSPSREFKVASSCPSSAPKLSAPLNTTVAGGLVKFSWVSNGAASYELWISVNGTAAKLAGTTSGTTLSANIPAGAEVKWYVISKETNCPSLQSTTGGFVTAGCSNPASTPIRPANGERVELPVTFEWTKVSGSTGYRIFVAANGAAPALVGSTSTATTLSSSSIPAGNHEWFVRTLFDGCPPVDSAKVAFAVPQATGCPEIGPSLVAPQNGAVLKSTKVTFEWTAVESAVGYLLYASFDGSEFSAVAKTETISTTIEIPRGRTVWYVEALFNGCPSVVSNKSELVIEKISECPTAAPTLGSPANNASGLTSPVSLSWSPVAGASHHVVWVSIDGSPAAPVTETTATSATIKLSGKEVVWYVEAVFVSCPSTFSGKRVFGIAQGGTCPTAAASPVAPIDGAAELRSPITFSWSGVEGASSYALQLSSSGAPFDTLIKTSQTSSAPLTLPAGTYSWRVVASFPGCPSTVSPVSRFTVRKEVSCPTETLTLLSPASGATVETPVTVSWSPVSGASSYRVWAGPEGKAPQLMAKTTGTSATLALPSGPHVWYVEAIRANCPVIVSGKSRFTVEQTTNCGTPQAPTLTSPQHGSLQSTAVRLEWTAVPDAIRYRVWVSVDGEPMQDVGTVAQTLLDLELPDGSIEWFVEAIYDGCPSAASPVSRFTIESPTECPDTAPILLSPGNGEIAESSPVQLIWSQVDQATAYRIWLSKNGAKPTLIQTTKQSSLQLPVEPGAYEWFVDAILPNCPANRSLPSRFTVEQRVECSEESALLLSPVSGETVDDEVVVFSWAPVPGATGYTVWYSLANGSWSSSPMTQQTSFEIELGEGNFSWFVTTHYAGCPARDSSAASFEIPVREECPTVRPKLLTPPDESAMSQGDVTFRWSAVPGAVEYRLKARNSDGTIVTLAYTTQTVATSNVEPGEWDWWVVAVLESCPRITSMSNSLRIEADSTGSCVKPRRPVASVPGNIASGLEYTLIWKPVPGVSLYEVQESSDRAFTTPTTTLVEGLSQHYRHTVDTPTPFFYRVRGISKCDDSRGFYSKPVDIVIAPSEEEGQINNSIEVGDDEIATQTIFIPGDLGQGPFRVISTVPWLTTEPSEGVLGPDGMTLQLRIDPTGLPTGTNTATLQIVFEAGAKTASNNDSGSTTIPVSASLVTPVSNATKGSPQPDSLIFPVVARAEGANDSFFLSDVRLSNRSASPMRYALYFTPSGSDATLVGESTEVQIDPGQTLALNDVLNTFFGLGTQGDSAAGTIEARPVTSSTGASTGNFTSGMLRAAIGSSRTYNFTEDGTFGQFIPAIAFSDFVGRPETSSDPGSISLQQISQSAEFRTNLGLVEGSGAPASGTIRAIDAQGNVVGTIPFSLKPGEQVQYNSILATNGIELEDGRFEISVDSPTGKLTAYASVVDNRTNDPRIVSPMAVGSLRAQTYVLPGVADLQNAAANWQTDMRLLNAGESVETATLTFYPQGNPDGATTVELVVAPGEMKTIDSTLRNLFGLSNTGGSIRIDTPTESALVATARTYNQTENGTYGQFIPAVTASTAVGLGESALQVLQLEESEQFRSNLGLFEVSGQPATVEITAIVPGAKLAPRVVVPLRANEFVQLNRVMTQLGLSNVYNGRVAVKVVDGPGRVSGYASVVDNQTQDPTYIPAQ